MHRFNGYDIELTQGDSLFFKINLDGRTLPEGSVGYFTVKKTPKSDEIIIQKKLDASDGVLDIRLMSEDTDLPVRTYYWDVRVLIPLEDGGYEVETPMEYAAFTIMDAVGPSGDNGEPPGMDADLPVLSVLIGEARALIETLSGFQIPDEQIDQSVREYIESGKVAPAIIAESGGDEIVNAGGGRAISVLAEINPRTENGDFAPSYNGGAFIGGEMVLTVNERKYRSELPSGVYAGSFDWATGEVISTARVVDVSNYSLKDSGTNSSGLNYVAIQNDGFSSMIVCNRYVRNDSAPYADKSIRVTGVSVYVYDSAIDLDNPAAILEGLEFLLPLAEAVTLQAEAKDVELSSGNNTVTADTGSVTVKYAVDTKTYIDEQDGKLEEQLSQLSEAIGDKVTSPSVAEVGQVIAVKAVDENGKPTEWEAVAMAAGGGVTSWNDLTDKPVVMDGGDTLTWDGNTDGLKVNEIIPTAYKVSGATPTIEDFANGATVAFDGTSFTFPASSFSDMDGLIVGAEGGVLIVSKDIVGVELEDGLVLSEAGTFLVNTGDTYVSSLTIPGYTGFDQEKIAPSHLYQPDWNQNDATKPDFIKNRPFGRTLIEVVPKTEIVGEFDGEGYSAMVDASLITGQEEYLLVTFDGVEYECFRNDSIGTVAYGNLAAFGLLDTGEPFTFVPSENIIVLNDAEPHIVEINNFIIDKLDRKYVDVCSVLYVTSNDVYLYTDSLCTVKATKLDLIAMYNKLPIQVVAVVGNGIRVQVMTPIAVEAVVQEFGTILTYDNQYYTAEYVPPTT